MSKRTFKNGHLVSTFPCNNGYTTVLYGKYGLQLRSVFTTDVLQAKYNRVYENRQVVCVRQLAF